MLQDQMAEKFRLESFGLAPVVELNGPRPKTRADCCQGERPCPWVGCRYNLFLDVDRRRGSIKLNFPHLEPDEIPSSCALDVADSEGGITLDETAKRMNLTRERIRQIQDKALKKVGHAPVLQEAAL